VRLWFNCHGPVVFTPSTIVVIFNLQSFSHLNASRHSTRFATGNAYVCRGRLLRGAEAAGEDRRGDRESTKGDEGRAFLWEQIPSGSDKESRLWERECGIV
jgi:hypothetical protein